MFRAQQNSFDEVVGKATDENLTSENWEYIMDVCDKVGPQDARANDVVAALIKRLAHRNANVQLYTLELANALSQNCGPNLHRELASRSFTDALLRLAGDRNTHTQVKAKILERMEEWTKMFSKNPDLGIMEGAYARLKSQNPNLHPPSKPVKSQITDADRRKEEEELQMALALSIKDKATISKSSQPNSKGAAQELSATSASSNAVGAQSSSISAHAQNNVVSVPSGTTAATVSRVRALYDFQPSEPGELQFRKGDIIAVLESVYKDWWKGSLRGQTGIFPLNYVEKLQDPTKEELEREAQMEAEVFAQIRNVEKLLALLSTSSKGGVEGDIRENEGITELYHSTLAIRPKLIELIGKYSQKKDDFTQLNEKFIKARRDYESLLEASMAQPPQPQTYGRPSYGYSPAPTSYSSPPPQQRYPQQVHHTQQSSPAPQDPYAQHQQVYPPQQQQPPQQQPMNPQQYYANSAPPQQQNQRLSYIGPGASGLPPELASTAYDAPVDGRQSAASHVTYQQPQPQQQQQQAPQQHQPQYDSYNPQRPYSSVPPSNQIQTQQPQPNYDSPTSIYTSGPDGQPYPSFPSASHNQQQQQVYQPAQPENHIPPPQQQQQPYQPLPSTSIPSAPAASAPSAIPSAPGPPLVPSTLQPYGGGVGPSSQQQQQIQAYAPPPQTQQSGGAAMGNVGAYPGAAAGSGGYVAYQPGMVVAGMGQDGGGRRSLEG